MTPALPSLLVVDDEKNMRLSLQNILRTDGYRMRGVESAEEALQALEEEIFFMVITDARLGGMSGYDFLSQVFYPGAVLCRVTVVKVGRTSIEHAVEMWDVTTEPRLAGRGRVVHVWIERGVARKSPWPPEMLAKCWDGEVPPNDATR